MLQLIFFQPLIISAETCLNNKFLLQNYTFGKPDISIGRVFRYPIEETLYKERDGRSFALVSDSKETILATICRISMIEGTYSRNRGIVTLAEDYIKHDVYLIKIIEKMDSDLINKFGENTIN